MSLRDGRMTGSPNLDDTGPTARLAVHGVVSLFVCGGLEDRPAVNIQHLRHLGGDVLGIRANHE